MCIRDTCYVLTDCINKRKKITLGRYAIMGIQAENLILYSFISFSDYILRKLYELYQKYGLDTTFQKTKRPAIGGTRKGLEMEDGKIIIQFQNRTYVLCNYDMCRRRKWGRNKPLFI